VDNTNVSLVLLLDVLHEKALAYRCVMHNNNDGEVENDAVAQKPQKMEAIKLFYVRVPPLSLNFLTEVYVVSTRGHYNRFISAPFGCFARKSTRILLCDAQ
jgi:hypothetical protein